MDQAIKIVIQTLLFLFSFLFHEIWGANAINKTIGAISILNAKL